MRDLRVLVDEARGVVDFVVDDHVEVLERRLLACGSCIPCLPPLRSIVYICWIRSFYSGLEPEERKEKQGSLLLLPFWTHAR